MYGIQYMSLSKILAQIKIKLLSNLMQKYSPEFLYPSDAYLDYHKARNYEYKALHQTSHKIPTNRHLNERNAIWYFLHSASEGYSSAQFKLGQCYLTGQLGLQTDPQKAQQWLAMAADQGHQEAKNTLLYLKH